MSSPDSDTHTHTQNISNLKIPSVCFLLSIFSFYLVIAHSWEDEKIDQVGHATERTEKKNKRN